MIILISWSVKSKKNICFVFENISGWPYRDVGIDLGALGQTLIQKTSRECNSKSRSIFQSYNTKSKQWNDFLLAIKWI